MHEFSTLLRRDLQLALRHGMDSFMVVMFFVIAVALFPFGVGPEPSQIIRDVPATEELLKLAV